jgi:EAL domain-containing protein (putative c-di-GMP-specific phosphodiesterase class I)
VIGALVLTLTLIPVLASLLFRRPPAERESPLLRWLRRPYLPALRWCLKRPRLPVLGAALGVVAALFVFSLLGKEFLPELDEGDLWVRTQFPIGISIEAVRPYVREIRERLLKFPEVRVVVSQLGAPDDGTDPEAPDNVEFYVGLRPREEWADPDKEKLVEAMTAALASIPGITTNFSQPIKDNVDEALAGTKGELAIKLYGPDFFVMDAKAKEIAAVLRETRLDAAALRLEITETVVMHDAPTTLAKLEALKALGVQLAIDDFGTGYASLSYLKRLPVDCLKIDRSLVKGVGSDTEDTAIVRAVVALARSLGIVVTAEGVETAEQLFQLRALGCEQGQGYHFARPVSADRLPELLSSLDADDRHGSPSCLG